MDTVDVGFRPRATPGPEISFSIKAVFYDTVSILISSKHPYLANCFMEAIPFDLPDSAYAWSNLVEAILESGLEEGGSIGRDMIDQWEEPEEPIWSVLVASELCESAETLQEQVRGSAKNRVRLEQFLACLTRTFRQAIAAKNSHSDLEQLQRLQSLQQLKRLEQLERLQSLQQLKQTERLTFSNTSYEKVEIGPNSIIYCDIPYKNTGDYDVEFDHDKFFDWAHEQEHPVFISEYGIKDERFRIVFRKVKVSLFASSRENKVELVYANHAALKLIKALASK
mgnify:CR=1 FL=1